MGTKHHGFEQFLAFRAVGTTRDKYADPAPVVQIAGLVLFEGGSDLENCLSSAGVILPSSNGLGALTHVFATRPSNRTVRKGQYTPTLRESQDSFWICQAYESLE